MSSSGTGSDQEDDEFFDAQDDSLLSLRYYYEFQEVFRYKMPPKPRRSTVHGCWIRYSGVLDRKLPEFQPLFYFHIYAY